MKKMIIITFTLISTMAFSQKVNTKTNSRISDRYESGQPQDPRLQLLFLHNFLMEIRLL